MKVYYRIILILLVLMSCNSKNENDPSPISEDNSKKIQQKPTLEGNWEMIGFYNYENNKIKDSFKTNEGYRQVKMFNKNKVMWSKLVPTDSIEWFGYGSYTATDSTLTEQMQYGSSVMNEIIAEQKEFNYKLVVTEHTFSQIRTDEEGNAVYSENYKRID